MNNNNNMCKHSIKKWSKMAVGQFCFAMLLALTFTLCACTEQDGSAKDTSATLVTGATLQENQPTPTDINYSLERYNLIKRAYWVNGQKEKARAVTCEIQRPLGYVVLFSGNTIVGRFVVDGKITSLNSYLTPDSEYYEGTGSNTGGLYRNKWLPDIDGSYGSNDDGIFFFTPDGHYYEWTGSYLYTDVPVEIDNPIVYIEGDIDG